MYGGEPDHARRSPPLRSRGSSPFTPPFNKWSANIPGATYFVPVTEVTALYLTILFGALGEEFAFFFHDDKDWLTRPAGITRFGKSKGGHLHDDVHDGRVGTIDEIETYLLEICGFEQGLMLQNIALATEALGLGGFPHYAAHRFAWTTSIGCQMKERTFAEVLHKGVLGTLLMRLLNKNVTIPQAVGLDHDGKTIIKPYAPPYYPTMEAAVRGVRCEQVRARDGVLPGRPRAECVARSSGGPSGHPRVLGGEYPGGHRLLRVRHGALRPIPRQLPGRSGR